MDLRVTLLGGFEVAADGTAVPVPGARLRGLLVRLALAGGRPVPVDALAGALWPEEQPADPVNALQALVSRLRRLLGGAGSLPQAEGGYRLAVSAEDVDALRFERLASDGRDKLRAGDPHAAAALLGEAVELWGDRAGAEPALIASVAPAVATRLALASVEAVAGLAEAELRTGRAEAAAARLTALLAGDPVHERAAALLMEALAAQGRQAEALAVYERIREALADRLGADPGAALREEHLRLLRSAPETRVEVKGNLPAPLTSFVGRDDDLQRVDTLLATGRLVTVVGPGGAGKTRLALEAARRHRHEYRDGAWLVDLSSVTEPAKVGAAVVASIGLRGSALFDARLRVEGDELDVLADQLTGRELLLVVDNCEHLVDAVAHLLAGLLRRSAGLRVLATSREALAIDGEALAPLGPLALPGPEADVDEARRTAAVRLFTERAAAVQPGFDVDDETLGGILEVVRRLDGMPLALELAAARLRTMTLAELAAGLSDRFRLLTTGSRTAFPRHRTLRAVIAWSWDLLSEHERTVARRVSILPGGVTAASATAVCAGTSVPPDEIPDLLAALVDKSLLQLAPEGGRYRMLETLREYGIEQGGLGDARDLAARYLARLVARHDPELRGPGQLTAMRVIRAEYDNALAALRHLCDTGDGDGAVALALDLTWYWQMFGRHTDAVYWLGEALAVPHPGGPDVERDTAAAILLLNRASSEHVTFEQTVESRPKELVTLTERLVAYPELPGLAGPLTAMMLAFLRETRASMALLQQTIDGPDVWLAALAHVFRAQFAENEGNLDQVRADVESALEIFGQVGDRWGLATVLPTRAMVRQYDGDLDGALADLRRARSLAREFGSLSLTDEIFIDLRWIDLNMRRGDTDLAIAMIEEVRERALRAVSPEFLMLVNAIEAGLWVRLGDLDRAESLIEQAASEADERIAFGGDHGRALAGGVRASIHIERGDPAGAARALAEAYEAALETQDMPVMSMVAVTGARLAELYGRERDAAVLLGAAARLRGAHDRTDPQIRELSARARKAIGGEAFAEAYSKGFELDGKAALTRVDPALLGRPGLPQP
ncbi:SARP family transcriptional regulator [Paractinoplanes deccanensis]|uniref:SARP family transcriptional regulator n=1 Tax=Paractinoplanes deccanensis TaxID=113561 RepID=A0ABQ3Y3G2_9ACTN|nr:BTAD domain-containing putative transcriptional regulator [Actinoplanes deccanensis]GID74537.1 SARP family transcriptional regulator [Actinoplanes deccanensis]